MHGVLKPRPCKKKVTRCFRWLVRAFTGSHSNRIIQTPYNTKFVTTAGERIQVTLRWGFAVRPSGYGGRCETAQPLHTVEQNPGTPRNRILRRCEMFWSFAWRRVC